MNDFRYDFVIVNTTAVAARGMLQASIDQLLNGVSS